MIDWGLAGKLQSKKESDPLPQGHFIGTPGFAAPEQVIGATDQMDERSDIFSLGAILYQLLVGKAPFIEGKKSRQEVVDATLHGDVLAPRERVPQVPRALSSICMKCLEVDRDKRYSSALEFARELERWKADLPVEALPETWRSHVARWLRKNQGRAILLLVSSMLILLFAIWANWMRGELRVTEALKSAAEQRANVEAAKAMVADSQREQALMQSSFQSYLRRRSDFENTLYRKQPGWLARGRAILEELESSPGQVDDRFWLASASRQLGVAEELIRTHEADKQSVFSPSKVKFSESGRFAIAGQHKAAAFISLRMLLYDTSSREVVQEFSVSTLSSAMQTLSGALSGGTRLKQEITQDVLISERLKIVLAVTTKGNLILWDWADQHQAPRVIDIGADPYPLHIALDDDQETVFVSRINRIEQWALGNLDKPMRVWHLEAGIADEYHNFVWDASHRRLYVGGIRGLEIIDVESPEPSKRRIDVPSQRIQASRDRSMLVCVGGGKISLIDMAELTLKDSIPLGDHGAETWHIRDASLSDDGVYLAICASRDRQFWCELWNLATGRRVGKDGFSEHVLPGFQFQVGSYELARLEESGLSWWKIDGAVPQRHAAMGSSGVIDAALAEDASHLLVSRVGQVESWDGTVPVASESSEQRPSRPTAEPLADWKRSDFVSVTGPTQVTISTDATFGLAYSRDPSVTGYRIPWTRQNDAGVFGAVENLAHRVAKADGPPGSGLLVVTPPVFNNAESSDTLQRIDPNNLQVLDAWSDRGAMNLYSGRGLFTAVEANGVSIFLGLRNGFVLQVDNNLSEFMGMADASRNQAIVTSLALSPDGRFLAAGTMLGELVLIEREPFKPIFWSTPHIGQGKCSSLVWLSPLQLASFGGDGMLICHELELPADADQATEESAGRLCGRALRESAV